ncbi:MAG: histidine kinase N-terminal 7TM domain-containing protein [Alkalispirochaeta sp.]
MADLDYTLYIAAAPVGIGALLVSVRSVWPYRTSFVAQGLIWYLAMVGAFLGANTLELVSTTPAATVFWAKMGHVFFLGSGLSWLAFAFAYAGMESFSRWPTFRWLTVAPVISSAIIWTNEYHHLFWHREHFTVIAGFLTMRPDYGPAFWISGFYLYTMLLLGVTLFVTTGARAGHLVRRQSLLVTAGAIVPVLVNLLYVFRIIPDIQKDYTPIAFALSGLVFFVAIHRFNLLRVFPLHHREILEDVSAAVITVDSEGVIWDMNHQAQEFLGMSAHAVGQRAAETPPLNSVLQNIPLDTRGHRQSSLVREAEETQHLDIWIKPIQQSHRGDRRAGSIITISDVTPWVQLVRERDTALRQLETEQARIDELQMHMRRRERLATIGQLAAGMAHEINNPLTFMRSSVREMERVLAHVTPPTDTDVGQLSSDIHQGLDRIEAVVQNLLTYARGFSRSRPRTTVGFAEIVRGVVALVRPALDGVNLTVTIPESIVVHCRSDEISQVLLNLLLNAIYAVHEGQSDVEPWIAMNAVIESTKLVCTVRDSGPGVPHADRTRVFDPFFSTKSDETGTGLGLSIAREIVHGGHGGRLYVADDAVSTFVMELPDASRRV